MISSSLLSDGLYLSVNAEGRVTHSLIVRNKRSGEFSLNNFVDSFQSLRDLICRYSVNAEGAFGKELQWFVDSKTKKVVRLSSNHFEGHESAKKGINNSNNNNSKMKNRNMKPASDGEESESEVYEVAQTKSGPKKPATDPWHHGSLEKHEAEMMLRGAHGYPRGSFLIRDDLESFGEST